MSGQLTPQPDQQSIPAQARGVRRVVYIALAAAFLALGVLGAVLPGLPTTPFLLLASYFLVRTSRRLHDRMLRMPLVGKSIREWHEKRGVRPHVKAAAHAMVLAAVVLSLLSHGIAPEMKAVIVICAATGACVVWRLPIVK